MRYFVSLAGQGHLCLFLKNTEIHTRTLKHTGWLGFPFRWLVITGCVTGAKLLHTRLICEQPDAKILVLDSRLSIY